MLVMRTSVLLFFVFWFFFALALWLLLRPRRALWVRLGGPLTPSRPPPSLRSGPATVAGARESGRGGARASAVRFATSRRARTPAIISRLTHPCPQSRAGVLTRGASKSIIHKSYLTGLRPQKKAASPLFFF